MDTFKKIKEFCQDGVSLYGKGPLVAAAVGALAMSIPMAMAHNIRTADAVTPSKELSAEFAQSIQDHLNEQIPGLGIAVIDLDSDVASVDQMSKTPDAECFVFSTLYPTKEVLGTASLGDTTSDAYSRFTVYTNVADCLGVDSPAAAKAFGLLMTAATTGSNDFPKLLSVYDEMHELNGMALPEEYWSATAWATTEAIKAMGGAEKLKDADILSLFHSAQNLVVEQDVELAYGFGVGFGDVIRGKDHHFVQVDNGIMDVHMVNWLQLVQDDVRPIGRYMELFDHFHSPADMRSPMTAANVDFKEALTSLEELGIKGNSSARLIAKIMGSDIDFDYEPFVKVENGFDSATLQGTFFDINPNGMFVVYDAEDRGFAVTGEDRRPVAIATVTTPPSFYQQNQGSVIPLAPWEPAPTTTLALR